MKLVLPPFLIVVIVALIGAFCVWAQQAWLAPSIGAAAFTQLFLHSEPGAKPYGIFIGQLIGAAAGFIGVYAVHATTAAKFVGDHDLSYDRLWAIIIAVAISAFVQAFARAKSPAGAATALVVAIGMETPDLLGAFRLVVGIALVTILGEAGRRLTLLALTERSASS